MRLKSPWELGALSAICPVPETNEENCKELLYPKAAIMVKESGEPTCCPLQSVEELGKGFVWFAEMTCVKAPWPEGSE